MMSGGFAINGQMVTLNDITCPVLAVVGEVDDIGQPASVRGIQRAAPSADVYETMIRTGHFGLVVGSKAAQVTWPTVAEWVQWVSGAGAKPANVEPMQDSPDEKDSADDSGVHLSTRVVHGVGEASEVALALARGAADAFVAANKSMRTLAVETIRTLPRLTRLGQINDHTRISLGRIISEQSKGSPDGEFLLFDGRVHTYEAVDRRINNVVRGLIDVGVRQGDHVGVLMETRPSALVAIAALSRLGAVSVLMPPDGDLVEAARLGGVAEILTDPTNLDAARQLSLQVLVLGGGESRDLHLSDNADVIDMEQINPDAVELPGWYRPNPGFARDLAFIAFSTVGAELVAKQITNYRWALSAFGTASAAALSASDTVYCLTPLHHQSGPAGGARRGGGRRSPHRPVPWPAARTASCRRSASTASPWSATPGRCSATSSTSPASSCTVTIRCGCSSVRACRRGCGSGSSRRSHRPGSWSSSRPPTGRPSSPTCRAPRSAARAGRCPAAARSNSRPTTSTPVLILEDDRGFVQVAATDQVGVLLARPRGPVDPTASREAWRLRARRHLGFHRVPVPPRRRR